MSYLAEQAGGKGSDGLDIQPEQVCISYRPLPCLLLILSQSGCSIHAGSGDLKT